MRCRVVSGHVFVRHPSGEWHAEVEGDRVWVAREGASGGWAWHSSGADGSDDWGGGRLRFEEALREAAVHLSYLVAGSPDHDPKP